MSFLVIVIVFLLVQYAPSARLVQQHNWFAQWQEWLRSSVKHPTLYWLASVIAPVLVVWSVLAMAASVSHLLVMLISIPLLLFALGHNEIHSQLSGYRDACTRKDNVSAVNWARDMGIAVDSEDLEGADDWRGLNAVVLRRVSYLGLQKWFVPIFWFLILGPAGAVMYRLSVLSLVNNESSEVNSETSDASQEATSETEQDDGAELSEDGTDAANMESPKKLAERLCWLMEWPVVRLLGFTFALTGNFESCLVRCQQHLLSTELSTEQVMEMAVHGALEIPLEEDIPEAVSELELEAVSPLLQRSLLLWLCVLAVLSLF